MLREIRSDWLIVVNVPTGYLAGGPVVCTYTSGNFWRRRFGLDAVATMENGGILHRPTNG